MVSGLIVSVLCGLLTVAMMGWRDEAAQARRLREELRRRDVAERAARSLERLTPTPASQTEIRIKVA